MFQFPKNDIIMFKFPKNDGFITRKRIIGINSFKNLNFHEELIKNNPWMFGTGYLFHEYYSPNYIYYVQLDTYLWITFRESLESNYTLSVIYNNTDFENGDQIQGYVSTYIFTLKFLLSLSKYISEEALAFLLFKKYIFEPEEPCDKSYSYEEIIDFFNLS